MYFNSGGMDNLCYICGCDEVTKEDESKENDDWVSFKTFFSVAILSLDKYIQIYTNYSVDIFHG